MVAAAERAIRIVNQCKSIRESHVKLESEQDSLDPSVLVAEQPLPRFIWRSSGQQLDKAIYVVGTNLPNRHLRMMPWNPAGCC